MDLRKKNTAPASTTSVATKRKKKKSSLGNASDSLEASEKYISKLRKEREKDLIKEMRAEIKIRKARKTK